MRKNVERQLEFGCVPIEELIFDVNSRDTIPKVLLGLQHLYMNENIMDKIFDELESILPDEVSKDAGRPGMDLWSIFVSAILRLSQNWDFDTLKEMMDNHYMIRQLLGHGDLFGRTLYGLTTLKENFNLLTIDVIENINRIIVEAGHALLGVEDEDLRVRIDSFVVKSNVHFPTDLNLLFDAMRKVMLLMGNTCIENDIPGWRQFKHNLGKIKAAYRKVATTKKSTSKKEEVVNKRIELIKEICEEYLGLCEGFLERCSYSLPVLASKLSVNESGLIEEVKHYSNHANSQINLIKRRLINDETIPHADKIFSLFEEYTEWICKGKAGTPQELGLAVCVVEDQHQFIINSKVMVEENDKAVAVPITKATKELFPNLISASFDRGFYSRVNMQELEKIIPDGVGMKKKGRYSQNDKEREKTDEFKQASYKHSAIESCINGLEHGGLDRCPDRSLNNFKRYVGIAVNARNVFRIGNLILCDLKEKEAAA